MTTTVPRTRWAAVLAVLALVAGSITASFAAAPAHAADLVDVARDATATAKSTYNHTPANAATFNVAHVNDGDSATRWGSRYTRTTSPVDTYDTNGEWVQLDLAEATRIQKVVLVWEAAYSTDYDVQVSHDGESWETVATRTTAKNQAVGGRLTQELAVDSSEAWEHVRMVSRSTATQYGLSLYSFEVWAEPVTDPTDPGDDSDDLARKGTATAKSTQPAAAGEEFRPELAIDGDAATRWSSQHQDDEPTYDPADWFQVELENPALIDTVVLNWDEAYARRFELQVSQDGVEWITLAGEQNATAAGEQTIFLEPSEAWRFVRMQGIEGDLAGYSLRSFEVYGTETEIEEPVGDPRDLAREGTTTAKNFYPTTNGKSFNPELATDGDSETRWGANYDRNKTPKTDPANWIQVELAKASRIHSIVLNWEAAYGRRFTLQVSNDGSAWTDLGGERNAAAAGEQTFVVDTPGKWKFVRVQGIEGDPTYGYSLFDFEIWNAEPVPVEEEPGGAIVPRPVSAEFPEADGFELSSATRIVAPATFAAVAQDLAATLRASTGWALPVVEGAAQDGDIVFAEGAAPAGAVKDYQLDEGYGLVSTATGVTITAAHADGAWFASRTLLQLLPAFASAKGGVYVQHWTVPAATIADYPRVESRGLMIDPARNFISVDEVKDAIDSLAAVKMNRLHIHLTDDQGWRIQIDSWPNLTAHGGTGSMAGGKSGFYTKQDFADIIAYAAAHRIEVIPEVDVPGHSDAAISSYPVLDCEERTIPIRTTGGISHNALCVGKPEVEQFLDDVIREVAEMSPSTYIHIGADEAEGVTDAQYGEFIRGLETIAAKYGKKIIGWTPMPKAGTTTDAVHQYWADRKQQMNTSWIANRSVILTPVNGAYMDYKFPGTPSGIGATHVGATYSMKSQYTSWDIARVVDANSKKNLNTDFGLTEDQVLGVEAAAWGETFKEGGKDMEFMVWPRTIGVADKGWSTQEHTASFDAFADRVGTEGPRLLVAGTNFFADPEVDWTIEAAGRIVQADENGAVTGAVAAIASPEAKLASFSAQISWPDGTTTTGQIQGTDASGKQSASLFTVTGSTTNTQPGSGTVTITGPDGFTTTVPFTVTAEDAGSGTDANGTSDSDANGAGSDADANGADSDAGADGAGADADGSGSDADANGGSDADGETPSPEKCTAPRAKSPFVDISKNYKFYTEIDWLHCVGYTTGIKTADGIAYHPTAKLTREAMAAFIYRMEAPKNYQAPKVSPFADLKPGDKFYTEITWMHRAKLTTGIKNPNGGKPLYQPKQALTREAMAAFIYRLEAPGGSSVLLQSPFADVKPGDRFAKEITWMHRAKLTTGIKNPNGGKPNFAPKSALTREAMAAFIYRLKHTD